MPLMEQEQFYIGLTLFFNWKNSLETCSYKISPKSVFGLTKVFQVVNHDFLGKVCFSYALKEIPLLTLYNIFSTCLFKFSYNVKMYSKIFLLLSSFDWNPIEKTYLNESDSLFFLFLVRSVLNHFFHLTTDFKIKASSLAPLLKKRSFPLRIFSVDVTKSTGSDRFGHIY